MFFSRSRGLQGPAYTPLYWNGDQLPTFDNEDGLQSSVTAMLSGGFSGMALTHSDIGGYTAVHFPGLRKRYDRNFELLARWCEVSAFTAVYRSHIGTLPTSLQVYDTNSTLAQFSKFANVYASWAVLRETLMLEASERGTPLARAMLIHHPDEPDAWGIYDQWMLGPNMVVAPVMVQGAVSREVWLPPSTVQWKHLWSGKMFDGGQRVTVDAPIGEPPVFTTPSTLSDLFFAELRIRNII